ncbi:MULTISPECIES: CapA family protein [unclassified Streptomyces]|uniref:CapA family protein n=1 Tax=unclassified Streptomyces TaxID=2593676 RepID=UPI0003708A94|nr:MULTISPECIES: CapA family protein [unclassified Streptomyces]MYT34257.1 CapA family protein [Streptomyces sp. SID8354]
MSAFTRYALAVLLAALAVGCGPLPDARPPAPRSAPTHTASRRPAAPSAPSRRPGTRAAGTVPARPFTLVATGDVIPAHPEALDTAQDDAPMAGGYDFRPMLRGVTPVVRTADLALCHLAAPLGPLDGPFTGYPELQAPPQVATALKATGFDSCATATDHALDQGKGGVRRTLDALDTVGLRHTGTARNAAEAARPTLLRVPGGAVVAHLAYTYDAEGARPPKDAPWAISPLDSGRILADARAARRAGADVVVVSPYWGTEYRTAPDARQRRLARILAAARTDGRPDIDLIVGSHTHTPQPFEKVHGTWVARTPDGRRAAAEMHDSGTWVAYGLGDLMGGTHHDGNGRMSAAARFTFTPPTAPGGRWKITKAEFVPLWWDARAGRVLDVDKAIKAGRPDLKPIRRRIRQLVLSRHANKAGLTMGR